MMDKLIDKLEQVDDSSEATYSAMIPVEVYPSKFGEKALIEAEQARVYYTIDIEWRSWGIKSIDIFSRGIIGVEYSTDKDGVVEQSQLQVDMSKVKVDMVKGGSVTAQALEIWLDESGQVDYAKSELVCSYIAR